jgi:hypothetical protein
MSRARPAHFAIFIPTRSDTEQVEKVIHVTRTTATGFFLEFKRNYDFRLEDRKYETIHLAQVNSRLISDTVGNGQSEQDTIARDILESTATIVPPPGRSPKPFDPSVCNVSVAINANSNLRPKQALNCQNWMESYVEKLVADDYIPSSAIAVLQQAPRRL